MIDSVLARTTINHPTEETLSYSDVVATLALIGTIPGILSLLELHKKAKAKICVDVTYPMFKNSPPGRLFLTISVTPGAKPIRVTSVEVLGSGLSCIAPLSTAPKDAAGMATDAPTADGPLAVAWLVPSRDVSGNALSAILLMSNLNKSSLSTIQVVVKWEAASDRRLKYTHKITMPIVLITASQERIKSPHAEALV